MLYRIEMTYGPTGWCRGKTFPTLEAAQRAYIAARCASGMGGSRWGSAMVLDATGAAVARISYNGRLWPVEAWHVGMAPMAEAPGRGA